MKKVAILFFSLILIVPASGQIKLEQVDPADIGKSANDYPAYFGCIDYLGAGGDLLIIPVESHQDSKWSAYIEMSSPESGYVCVMTWRFVPKDPPGSQDVKVADLYVGEDHFDVLVDYGYYTRITTNLGGKAYGWWFGQLLCEYGYPFPTNPETGLPLPPFPIHLFDVSARTGYEFLWLSGMAVELGLAWSIPYEEGEGAHVWFDMENYFLSVPEQCYIRGTFGVPVEPGLNVSVSLPRTVVNLEFDEITSAGHVIPDYASGPELPSGLQLGNRGRFYDITTTANFSGSIEVAIDYSNMEFTVPEEMLQLYHYNGAWNDCTTYIDTLNDIIYGRVDSLSIFAVVQNSSPPVLIEQVIVQLENLDLDQGIENSLNSKLESALNVLDDLNENNDVAAINSLEAFINAVEAQRGKKISEEDADALIDAAQQIIDMLING